MEHDYNQMIDRKVKYAADSYSLEMMYYIYGVLEGLHMADAIDDIYYFNTSCRICKDYFNNAAWRKECYRRWDL